MHISQVAVQLYTLRDHCRTPADIATTLKRVAAIGYQAVQVSGIGPIAEDELVAIARGEGLVLCATHEPGDVILNEPARVVDRLARLGCRYTAYPYPSGIDFQNPADLDRLITGLDAAGALLRQHGQTLCYHNHALEFARVGDQSILELIYARTAAENLQGEIDTYWVQAGGDDPVKWCRRLHGRLPLLHLKDLARNAEGQPVFAEVGHGTLDIAGIIAAAEESGCEWFIVEQDTCPGDPFASIQLSFEYLRDHIAR